ncbi:MAG: hypothetical protein GC150_09015 [Rhizobiales bacterium]|nr:hypothetical protein [Hyphomicrobiales bacterium]
MVAVASNAVFTPASSHLLTKVPGAAAANPRPAGSEPQRAYVVWHDWSAGRAEERRIGGLPRLSRTVGLQRCF